MATNPVTYRISPEVDAELKALAEKHGGVDKALRRLLEAHRDSQQRLNAERTSPLNSGYRDVAEAATRPFKGPLLKPSAKEKK